MLRNSLTPTTPLYLIWSPSSSHQAYALQYSTNLLHLPFLLLHYQTLFYNSKIFISHSILGVSSKDSRMKFGKRLKHQIQETLPAWRDNFLSYKELKKLVRLISSAPPLSTEYGKAEAEFVYLLNNEIDKFNVFFMEQEEDFIIRHKVNLQLFSSLLHRWCLIQS